LVNPFKLWEIRKVKVTMGLDLRPDGLTAGLAGHWLDKNIFRLRKKK